MNPGTPLSEVPGVPLVDIIIPTLDNPNYLIPCLNSLGSYTVNVDNMEWRALVVNNGTEGMKDHLMGDQPIPHLEWVDAGSNLGWEGGLKLGLDHSKSPLVLFMNDDVQIPPGNSSWLRRMTEIFIRNPDVAAVGPKSTYVMGLQSVSLLTAPIPYAVHMLVGFCMMVRRDVLDAIGGVAQGMPGGDDLDLSCRINDAGWKMVLHGDVFVIHAGSVTGRREHKDAWNSNEHIDATRMAVIKRNGFKSYATMFMNEAHPL